LTPTEQRRVRWKSVIVAAGYDVDFNLLEPPKTRLEMSGQMSEIVELRWGRFSHLNTFWYISGQLVMLPLSIRICIKSQESNSMPCHGDSMSRWWNVRLGGILQERSISEEIVKTACENLQLRLNHGEIYSNDVRRGIVAVHKPISALLLPSQHAAISR
jgi:hypothetical protein